MFTAFATTSFLMCKNEMYSLDVTASLKVVHSTFEMIADLTERVNDVFLHEMSKLTADNAAGSETSLSEKIQNISAESGHYYLTDTDGKIVQSNLAEYIGKNIKDLSTLEGRLQYMEQNEMRVNTPDPEKPIKDFSGDAQYYFYCRKLPDDSGYLTAGFPEQIYMDNLHQTLPDGSLSQSLSFEGTHAILDHDRNVISVSKPLIEGDFDELRKIIEVYEDPESHKVTSNQRIGRSSTEMQFPMQMGEVDHYLDDTSIDTETVSYDFREYYYSISEKFGFYFISILPEMDANFNLYTMIIGIIVLCIVVFVVLFVLIRLLVYLIIVRHIQRINESLGSITNGNLEEKINERNTREFDALSTDINLMVDRLKGYIAEAAARIDADLAIAKQIQQSAVPNVFPPFPDRHEFDLFASMRAAKEIGGDFYDFFMIDSRTLGFLIADVSGKSIPGAMFMMRAKSVIKSLATTGIAPDEVFIQANNSLCEDNEADMFVTAWMGYLDLKTGLITYANAGHNPPVLIHDGKPEYLTMKAGLILGELDGIPYKKQTLQMQKGDFLFLYTDGVTEAMNTANKLYGEERLQNILTGAESTLTPHPNGNVGAICRKVSDDIAVYTQGAEQSDDITMLCLQYKGENADDEDTDH